MAAANFTWYQSKVRRIYKDVKALKQKDIAEIENITQQAVSEGISTGKYLRALTKWIQILDIAGYEIREKEA